jgi:hypothetical protein
LCTGICTASAGIIGWRETDQGFQKKFNVHPSSP